MTAPSKERVERDPRSRQRDLGPGPGKDRPKATRGKHRERKSRRTAILPSQSRGESRQMPQDLQDIERDVAAGAEQGRYDIERE